MNNITVDRIMELKPCEAYTRKVVENLWDGKESLSLKEILDLGIHIEDSLWVLARLVPTEIAVKWAQYCADKAKEYAATKAADDAYWAAECADWAAEAAWAARNAARNAWTAAYAAKAAWAAHWASNVRMNYKKTLYNLLTTLIEMTEEN